MRRTKEERDTAFKTLQEYERIGATVTVYEGLRQEVKRLRDDLEDAEREIAELRNPPRGPCGMRSHAADCECNGMGGDR